MKKFILIGSFLFSSCLSAGQYAAASFGTDYYHQTNSPGNHQKVGYKVSGFWGYKFESQFRAEAEVAYRSGKTNTKYVDANEAITMKTFGSQHSWSYMANIIYDIGQLEYKTFVPYAGIGVGYVQNTMHKKYQKHDWASSYSERDDRFAYQGIIGIKYPIAEKLALGAQYNYFVGSPHAKNHSVAMNLLRDF
jgi:opacity protein-like surface antigen